MKSKSGILDSFKETLNPAIWVEMSMKEEFKNKVLSIANSFCTDNNTTLKGVLIYGGNAGYQYCDASDIDISVYVDWDNLDEEKYESYADDLRSNKFIYENIEVHFMLKSSKEKELAEANENVYNIVDDKWIQEPVRYDFDPKEEFAKSIDKANIFKIKLQEKYNEAITELKELREAGVIIIPKEALTNLEKLVDIVSQIRKNRDIEHAAVRKRAINGEKITIFDRVTDNEITWKTISNLPMTTVLKNLSYKK